MAAPNVLLVIADDMGIHQLGCYGSSFYETRCIDALASEGARFDCAYSASPVCSPARAALYTGLHPARLHLTNYIPGTAPANPRLLTPAWRAYLPVEAVTLGDIFKVSGYRTAHFGKWHLAPDYHYRPGRPMDPESQGFDQVLVTRKPPPDADPEQDPHHIDHLTDEAIRFMSTPGGKPFLCVVAHNAVHRPEIGRARDIARYARKLGADSDVNRPALGAMTEHMDRSVGRLLDHLKASGLDRETIVVFTSDHGAFARSERRKPLRGAKADLYEGGVRVPLLLRWPGHFDAGLRKEPVFGTDLFATLLDLAGIKQSAPLDGVSFRGQLEGRAGEGLPRPLFWHFPHYHHLGLAPCGAMRLGQWKLVEWFEGTIGGASGVTPYELYNVESDPGESRNLAIERADICSELMTMLREWRARIGAQEMKPNPDFNPGDSAHSAPPPPGDPGNPYGE